MRYIVSLLLFSLFVCLTADAQTRRGRVKSSVKRKEIVASLNEAPPRSADAIAPSIGLIVEKYVSSYDIGGDGTGRQTLEMQQRCKTEACVARGVNFKRVYNGNLEKFRLIEASVIKAGGTAVRLPQTAFTDRTTDQTEAAPGFSSLREVELRFDDLEVGDAAHFKLEITTVRSNFDGRFDSLEMFPVLFDWRSIEINVTAPVSYPLFIEGSGLDGGKLADLNGRSRWQFTRKDLAHIGIEPMMHDVVSVSPRFALTNFRSFEELGSAYWEAMKQKAIVTPEIKALADEVTKGVTDPSQQASLIYQWVNKNVRYLSVVLDRGGWIPHSATEVIANRYGDCKDYATVILTLLKAKGIESTPVLIRSDTSEWFPGVATADYFNHAILYIPSIDMFADATMPNTRLGLVPQVLVGKKAVLAGERTGLVRVPDNNPDGNQVISDVSLEFQPNGDLKARTKNTYIGRSEILFRPMFGDSGFARQSPVFVRSLLAFHGVEGDGTVLNVGDPHKVGEPFGVEIEAKIGNFTTFLPKGTVSIPEGVSMVNMRAMEMFVSSEKRQTSMIIGATIFRESFSVVLPDQVRPTSPPPAAEFSNALGRFKIASEMKDKRITFTRELVLARDIVRPSDYSAFKELIGKMLAAHDVNIAYTADPSLLREKSRELRSSRGKAPKPATAGSISDRFAFTPARKLRPADVQRMEAKIKTNENDLETRLSLVRHYYWHNPAGSRALKGAFIRHRLWLIEHRPEMGDAELLGLTRPEIDPRSEEFRQLKEAWTARVDAGPKNSAVLANAVDFLRGRDDPAAEKLVRNAMPANPDDYKLPLLLTDIFASEFHAHGTSAARRLELSKKLIDVGSNALVLIRKERSDERDADRGELLKRLSYAALETGDLDGAAVFAKELVLDFGQSSTEFIYDEVAHIGNTILGLVELRRNNLPKAKEHLLTSMRAPLRKDYNSLSRIETRLAKELFDRGEKDAVLEYLALCLNLKNLKEYPESYADEIRALKLWRDQIARGVTPTFEFNTP